MFKYRLLRALQIINQAEERNKMKLKKLSRILVTTMLTTSVIGTFSAMVSAEPAKIPSHNEPYSWNSGIVDGNNHSLSIFAASNVISVTGVPWLKLNLTGTKLGKKSYIEISSLKDGAVQVLDASTLSQWKFQSAYFNGDSVSVKLYAAPGDKNVVLNVSEITVGEYVDSIGVLSICGSDNRVATTEGRVARIDPIGCTGWIIDNGQLLSAGHCLAGSGNDTLSFNPPASLSDGTVQFPGPEDQYSINQSSFDFVNGGIGNDWGTFDVFNNAQTGFQPIDVQGSYSIKQDLNPSTIRITGFGVDSGTTNQTNQTNAGPNDGSSGTTMRYVTDTQGGNSGSPVIDDATGEAVGIHTHGGCSSSSGNNSGTSFFNSALWTAVEDDVEPPEPLVCPEGTINFNSLAMTSYSNQNADNNSLVGDNGDSILLTGNTWVRSTQLFNITSDTVIDFMFASGSQGEIHAIGFDNNDTLNDDPRHFQFWGTQNWTGTGQIDLTPKYSAAGDYQSYSIPVGQSYTGDMYLVLTNDNDSGSNNESRFACVAVHEAEPASCDVEESFESDMGGWTTGGSCTTGTFTIGTPDEVVNGGVTTQVGGAQHGSSALFTQPNTGGAGTDDVDGGECVTTSPIYAVTADSNVSMYYFHGQRDAGDDASDGFELEVSVNGGSFQPLVSLGDVTSNAIWTEESFTASAGDTVQLQVRASDAAGAGDLVEAGIDNLQICAQ